MNDLYYIPTQEDFRIGFQFEHSLAKSNDYSNRTIRSIKEDDDDDVSFYAWIAETQAERNRVPYLTAEQIEAEGWEDRGDNKFTKEINDELQFVLIFGKQHICIKRDIGDMIPVIYNGSCRCINDFRLICKLLNIK